MTASDSPSPLSLTTPVQLALSFGPREVVGYDQKVYSHKTLSSSREETEEKKDQKRTEEEMKEDKKVLNIKIAPKTSRCAPLRPIHRNGTQPSTPNSFTSKSRSLISLASNNILHLTFFCHGQLEDEKRKLDEVGVP